MISFRSFALLTLLSAGPLFSQATGLAGWDIILDPGHSRFENMGIYGYSEAEKNLRVAINLRSLLLDNTDIDTVYITRTDDQQLVGLSERTDLANQLGTQWFHSIHSDAGAPESNSTLLLWGQYLNGLEKNPPGGQAMSDIMVDILTAGMRTNTRGSIGDCSFYRSFIPDACSGGGPYLSVNRRSTMPSELSEAGFHTSPTQNQLNMNAEWKRLEAYTFFWSILEYHGIARQPVSILTGIIKDPDTGIPINGAMVYADDQTYTTDTWESLFYKYTQEKDLLHNGFYFLEDLAGQTVQVIVEHPDYYPDTAMVTLNQTDFTFKDFNLVSTRPPTVLASTPVNGDTAYNGYESIYIDFSRPMNVSSVENALLTEPQIIASHRWSNGNRNLEIIPDSLQFETEYSLTIDANASDIYGHPLDGNNDGVGGDPFVLAFKTGQSDLFPPEIISSEPGKNQINISLLPIISFVFDEVLDEQSISPALFNLAAISNLQQPIEFILEHYVVQNQSIISLFPVEKLEPLKDYRTRISPGLKDLLGNTTASTSIFVFKTAATDESVIWIDNFEGGSVTSYWWAPQQSGSTTGILTESTSRATNGTYINLHSPGTTSMQVSYGWDVNAGSWLIREYVGSGAPREVIFDSTYTMQVYLFGDGSGTKIRFAVDDRIPATDAAYHEVSPWFVIDWVGWKLVEWNMGADGTGSWLGDGVLDGSLRFDSFQLAYDPALPSNTTGAIYLDDLRLVKKVPVGIDREFDPTLPETVVLKQNYPNPFNPATTIEFILPAAGRVRLELFDLAGRSCGVLLDSFKSSGTHAIQIDGSALSSGVYIYTLTALNNTVSRKMILVK